MLKLANVVLLCCSWAASLGINQAQGPGRLAHSPGAPSQDPFYSPPKGYELLPTGSILRSRRLEGLSIQVPVQDAYHLLYSTVDDVGRPGASVTTVIVPPNATFEQHVAYHSPYDAANADCGPSYALVAGSKSNYTASLLLDAAVMGAVLSRGIVVSTSDYEGHDGAFTAGPQTARGVLDAVKAVVASKHITGVSSRARTVLTGYSGGSIAVEWASEFAASYAPGLNIVGAALGGLPVNQTTVLSAIAASDSPGLAFASLNGQSEAYPSFAKWLSTSLVPSKIAEFRQAKHLCQHDATGKSGGYTGLYAGQNLFSYFKKGKAAFQEPFYQDFMLRAGIMGRHGVPRGFPLYIFKGTADEVTPSIEETDELVQKYCAKGATVKYYRYLNGTHETTGLQGYPAALAFVFGTSLSPGLLFYCSASNNK